MVDQLRRRSLASVNAEVFDSETYSKHDMHVSRRWVVLAHAKLSLLMLM